MAISFPPLPYLHEHCKGRTQLGKLPVWHRHRTGYHDYHDFKYNSCEDRCSALLTVNDVHILASLVIFCCCCCCWGDAAPYPLLPLCNRRQRMIYINCQRNQSSIKKILYSHLWGSDGGTFRKKMHFCDLNDKWVNEGWGWTISSLSKHLLVQYSTLNAHLYVWTVHLCLILCSFFYFFSVIKKILSLSRQKSEK